jgi:hypothetical protein
MDYDVLEILKFNWHIFCRCADSSSLNRHHAAIEINLRTPRRINRSPRSYRSISIHHHEAIDRIHWTIPGGKASCLRIEVLGAQFAKSMKRKNSFRARKGNRSAGEIPSCTKPEMISTSKKIGWRAALLGQFQLNRVSKTRFLCSEPAKRPFRILGLQQVAIGAEDKRQLLHLWQVRKTFRRY